MVLVLAVSCAIEMGPPVSTKANLYVNFAHITVMHTQGCVLRMLLLLESQQMCDFFTITAGTGLFIQWINSEYMENKFKISSNTNSPIIFWIYLKFILQFVSILFSAYIQNIVVKYTVNKLKSKCGGHLSTATHYLQQINLLSCEIWKEQERDDGHAVLH